MAAHGHPGKRGIASIAPPSLTHLTLHIFWRACIDWRFSSGIIMTFNSKRLISVLWLQSLCVDMHRKPSSYLWNYRTVTVFLIRDNSGTANLSVNTDGTVSNL